MATYQVVSTVWFKVRSLVIGSVVLSRTAKIK